MTKRALITGITGQDGSYLAELLLDKGYDVFGLIRRSSSPNLDRILHIKDRLNFISGDLLDLNSLITAVRQCRPDEVYNLAAQSFAGASWEQPIFTGEVTALGVTRMLDAIRVVCPEARFYQASSSEMFGKANQSLQNEQTPFYPRSPYAVAKVYAHHITVNYRESYGLHATSGILYNHESPRRGLEFVTHKVTDSAVRIKCGVLNELHMGNLDARRDWGYAGDYVQAMWMMLQQEQADDYVIGSGETHTIRELLDVAFDAVGLSWKDYVVIDQKFMRPVESMMLMGDYSKASRVLGWSPTVHFEDMIERMVKADMDRLH